MFVSLLFTIAKTWKQPKCLSTMNSWWYIYRMQYYCHKKNEIMPFAATCVDPQIIILSDKYVR